MDTRPFVEGLLELREGFVRLLDAVSALRELSAIRVKGQAEAEVIAASLEVLMHNQDLERCSVFLLNDEHLLVNVAGLDWADLIDPDGRAQAHIPKGIRFHLGEGIVGLAAELGELQHCRNCQSDPRFLRSGGEPPPPSLGSLMSVPIQMGDQIIGVLNVSHPEPEFFTVSHERTLIIFCNFMAQLLSNNRLLTKMDSEVQLRTRQLEEALAEARELKSRYEALSVIDELTGLHNRRFFFPEARSVLSQAIRHGHGFAIIIADLDFFKQINDTYGHAAGDEVLRDVAKVLRSQMREGDILARFGGEEFVFALPATDIAGASALGERMRQEIAQLSWNFDGAQVRVTVTAGVSSLGGDTGRDTSMILENIVSEADQALYAGKKNGRDQVFLWDDVVSDPGN